MTDYDVFDDDMQCPNCGGQVVLCYVHWGEIKDYCKICDLTFIYNKGDRFKTIEFVERDHFSSQEVIEAGNSTESERGFY